MPCKYIPCIALDFGPQKSSFKLQPLLLVGPTNQREACKHTLLIAAGCPDDTFEKAVLVVHCKVFAAFRVWASHVGFSISDRRRRPGMALIGPSNPLEAPSCSGTVLLSAAGLVLRQASFTT